MRGQLGQFFSIKDYSIAARKTSLRQVGLFTLLLVLWIFPVLRIHIFIHEAGHALFIYLSGGTSYGIILDPLPKLPQGWLDCNSHAGGATSKFIFSLSGTSVAAIFGLLLMPIGARLPPRSTFRIFIGLFTGTVFLHFLFYLLASYYAGKGDFHAWPQLLGVVGKGLMPLLFFGCLPLGYVVGRWFFSMTEAWIPASSHHERMILALMSVGALFLTEMIFHTMASGFTVTTPWTRLLSFIGGLIAVWRMPIRTPGPMVRVPLRTFLIPTGMLIGIETTLITMGGYLPIALLPLSVPPASAVTYTDTKLVSLSGNSLLTVDNEDDLYFTEKNALYQNLPRENRIEKIWEPPEGEFIHPITCHDNKVYLIVDKKSETDDPQWISTIAMLDPDSGRLITLINNHEQQHIGFGVDDHGDVLFTQNDQLMRHIVETGQDAVIREKMPGIYWIEIGPDDWIYLLRKAETWPTTREYILERVSANGDTLETLCEHIPPSNGFDIDAKGNIYLANGRSVIERSAPGYNPVRLGGTGKCIRPHAMAGGGIAYLSEQNKKYKIRLLSPAADRP